MHNLRNGPMRASHAPSDLARIIYPVFASPKIDGIRAVIVTPKWYVNNVVVTDKALPYLRRANHALAVSRTLKPIPNLHVQNCLDQAQLVGLDGELVTTTYNQTQSAIMSHGDNPTFTFNYFDDWQLDIPFQSRIQTMWNRRELPDFAVAHYYEMVGTSSQLDTAYNAYLADGYEGAIIRSLTAPYKSGKSTVKQGWMLKIKPLKDKEAVVTGIEQGFTNYNPAETDERGYTKRSSHKANKVPDEIVGALVGKFLDTGQEIRVGIFKNVTKPELRDWWTNRDSLIGRIMKISYLDYGLLEAPRHTRFIGWRSRIDTCYAAAPGTSISGSRAAPTAAGLDPIPSTSTLGFGYSARQKKKLIKKIRENNEKA